LGSELLQKEGISKEDFAKIGDIDREIALGGDYRKLICKPSDVSFEIMTYKTPLQPLIQTDLMKSVGEEITAAPISSIANDKQPSSSGMEPMDDDANNNMIFGMVVGFSLPPSAYATIALRELTKRPTSSEYQSKLQLSGRCEQKIDN
jgi:tRNA pseudouridine13 synthase